MLGAVVVAIATVMVILPIFVANNHNKHHQLSKLSKPNKRNKPYLLLKTQDPLELVSNVGMLIIFVLNAHNGIKSSNNLLVDAPSI